MQLKELYDALGGNYNSVRARIPKDDIIEKFLIKFLSEPSFARLKRSLERAEYEEAFRAVHSIKGICANLAFTGLEKSSDVLTEFLRGKERYQVDREQCLKLFEKVSEDYELVVDTIKRYM